MEAREFKDEFIKINTELEGLIDKVTLSAEQRKVYEPKAISLIKVIRAFRNYGILGDTHGYYSEHGI
jgi:hypothetical protein